MRRGVWEVLAAPRREPGWVRLRRAAAVAVAAVVMATGVVTIAGQVLTWTSPPPASAPTPAVSDDQFAAVAAPFAVDYLSWSESDRQARQTALARSAAPDTSVDGWSGTGRQWADSPTAIGIARSDDNDPADGHGDGEEESAVVTVRVRVIPFTATEDTATGDIAEEDAGTENTAPDGSPAPDQPPEPSAESTPESTLGRNVASGSVPDEPGWTAGAPRWLNLAVPVRAGRGGRVVVTAPPALVGSPQPSAQRPAVPSTSTAEDARFARDTRGTVTTLLRSYGTGELQYARWAGTAFAGLDNAAVLDDITSWRVHDPHSATDGADGGTGGSGDEGERVRAGDVTVMWALSGGAGALRCTYRVELRADTSHHGGAQDGRWYLATIGVPTEAVT